MDTAAETVIETPGIKLASTYDQCTADLAADKASYASDLSAKLKATGHPTAMVAAGKVDAMCAAINWGATSMDKIDQCFRGTRSALQLFDRQTQQSLGANEWEGLRQRAQTIKQTGSCPPAHRIPGRKI